MDQQEMLRRIAAAARKGQQPDDPEAQRMQASQNGWNLPIEPGKPDPEAAANAQINAAAPQMPAKPMIPAPKQAEDPELNQLSSDLDLILQAKPEQNGQMPMENPENPSAEEQSRMNRLMWLKQKSQGAQ